MSPSKSSPSSARDTFHPMPARAHSVESAVCRELLAESGASFDSLVVRRIPNGVCLEGVMHADVPADNVSSAARRVDGVVQVRNNLLVCHDGQ